MSLCQCPDVAGTVLAVLEGRKPDAVCPIHSPEEATIKEREGLTADVLEEELRAQCPPRERPLPLNASREQFARIIGTD